MNKSLFFKIIFLTITFLALFSLPLLQNLAKECKREMKMAIIKNKYDTSDLEMFSETELKNAQWEDKEEFALNGKLYDVVSVKFENGQRIYYCLSDVKETIVKDTHRFLVSVFKKENQKPTFSTPKVNPLFYQNVFVEKEADTILLYTNNVKNTQTRFHYFNNYTSYQNFSILDPPKKLLS